MAADRGEELWLLNFHLPSEGLTYLSRMLSSSPASRTSLMSDSAAGSVSITGSPELDGSANSMSYEYLFRCIIPAECCMP